MEKETKKTRKNPSKCGENAPLELASEPTKPRHTRVNTHKKQIAQPDKRPSKGGGHGPLEPVNTLRRKR